MTIHTNEYKNRYWIDTKYFIFSTICRMFGHKLIDFRCKRCEFCETPSNEYIQSITKKDHFLIKIENGKSIKYQL